MSFLYISPPLSFVNNLFRSPIEVAQAALLLQKVSSGRFELGVGAGWAEGELLDAGMIYPPPRDRAGMYAESIQIIRSLITDGTCAFKGQYYQVDTRSVGPLDIPAPKLIGSVGGPRTVREVTPHVDRVEIKASSASTRGGKLDLEVMAQIPEEHLFLMIERVRNINPDIELGMFVLCNAGSDSFTRDLELKMGENLYGRFFGSPEKVADGLGMGPSGLGKRPPKILFERTTPPMPRPQRFRKNQKKQVLDSSGKPVKNLKQDMADGGEVFNMSTEMVIDE